MCVGFCKEFVIQLNSVSWSSCSIFHWSISLKVFFIALLSPHIQYFCNTFSHLHLFSHFLRHGLGLRLDWTFKSSELLLWNKVFSLTLISIYVWETESVFIHANSESYMLKLFCFPNIDDNLDICIYGLAHVTLYRNWHAHKSRCKKWPSSSLKRERRKKRVGESF